MWPNPQDTADLATFTKEIFNGKLHFLCSGVSRITGITNVSDLTDILFISSNYCLYPHSTLIDLILYSKVTRAVEIIVVNLTSTLWSSCYFWVLRETSHCTICGMPLTNVAQVSMNGRPGIHDACGSWRVVYFRLFMVTSIHNIWKRSRNS